MTHGAETSRVGQFCSIIPPCGGSLLRYRNQSADIRWYRSRLG